MCVIVDNNLVSRVLVKDDPQFAPVKKSIMTRRHKLVHGGKLTREYVRDGKVRSVLRTLDEAGLSRIVDAGSIENRVALLTANKSCCSDDSHVIALAQVSNTRLLCSLDNALIADFRNKALIDKPRGSVYKCAEHERLVQKGCKVCRVV